MKKCTKCSESKDRAEFYKDKHAKDGLKGSCKVCHKSYVKNRYEADPSQFKSYQKKRRADIFNSQGGYVVYYLPEHNYVGMTNNLVRRIADHSKSGKITEGYEIVGTYKTSVEAHLMETQLHFAGYEGFNYKGIINNK